jgi:hypothetical protein
MASRKPKIKDKKNRGPNTEFEELCIKDPPISIHKSRLVIIPIERRIKKA